MRDVARRARGGRRGAAARPVRGAELAAAALAAAAEAGLLFLPLRLLLAQAIRSTSGPLLSYPVFLGLFVAATAVAADLRRQAALPLAVAVGCVAVGVAQARVWGGGGPAGMLVAVILTLLVGMRLLALAFRDWRDPIAASFAAGAVVLVAELGFGALGASATWGPALPAAVVAAFFVCSLASRAASVRASAEVSPRESDRRLLARLASGTVGVAALGVALTAALGGRSGPLHLIGDAVLLAVAAVLSAAVYAFAWLMRPVFWVVSHFHFDILRALQRALSHVSLLHGQALSHGHAGTAPPAVARVIGLLVLAGIGWMLFRAVRRLRPAEREDGAEEAAPEPDVRVAPIRDTAIASIRSRRRRRELPSQTVRRWYAETLLALASRGVDRPPEQTPAEFARRVGATMPAAAAGFGRLTRAYEEARYGLLVADEERLGRLDGTCRELAGIIRRWQPPDRRDAAPR